MEIKLLNIEDCEQDYRDFNSRQWNMLAQHSYAWLKTLNKFYKCMVLAEYEDDKIVAALPFCEHRTEIGSIWMSNPCPASYGGILYQISERQERDEIWREWERLARENNIDILTILTSPSFVGGIDEIYCNGNKRGFLPTYVHSKFYQYLPNVPIEAMGDSKFRNNLQRNLKKASDFTIENQNSESFQFGVDFNHWYDMIKNRAFDIDAKFPKHAFLRELSRNLLNDDLMDFAIVRGEKRVVGGGMYIKSHNEKVRIPYFKRQDIYFRAVETDYLKLGLGMKLDCKMIESFNGIHNFQSSPSRESLSYKYKKNWGCLEGQTYYMTKVLSNEKKFIDAGKEGVSRQFEDFYVLPYEVYK